MKLLCWIGFHGWTEFGECHQVCSKCDRVRAVKGYFDFMM